jgi:hypothetical protein
MHSCEFLSLGKIFSGFLAAMLHSFQPENFEIQNLVKFVIAIENR